MKCGKNVGSVEHFASQFLYIEASRIYEYWGDANIIEIIDVIKNNIYIYICKYIHT